MLIRFDSLFSFNIYTFGLFVFSLFTVNLCFGELCTEDIGDWKTFVGVPGATVALFRGRNRWFAYLHWDAVSYYNISAAVMVSCLG